MMDDLDAEALRIAREVAAAAELQAGWPDCIDEFRAGERDTLLSVQLTKSAALAALQLAAAEKETLVRERDDLRARVRELEGRGVAEAHAAMREACDLLAERTHGNPARSPGHNARVVLEAFLRTADAPPASADVIDKASAEMEKLYRDIEGLPPASAAVGGGATFQSRVDPWLLACFGETIARDKSERSHRFLEEALELVQAAGCTVSEAHQLVDYTFNRPSGDLNQEVGGVMVTLAALCLAHGVDMHAEAETELARIWAKVDKIRAKQAAKPKCSPLPEAALAQGGAVPEELRRLSEAATKGPWELRHNDEFFADGEYRGMLHSEDDAAFIVAAVNYVRELIAAPPAAPVTSSKREG